MKDVKEIIFRYVSKHEIIVSNELEEDDITAGFTTFGTRAGCRAIEEVFNSLDDETKAKVIEMMKNKRINK